MGCSPLPVDQGICCESARPPGPAGRQATIVLADDGYAARGVGVQRVAEVAVFVGAQRGVRGAPNLAALAIDERGRPGFQGLVIDPAHPVCPGRASGDDVGREDVSGIDAWGGGAAFQRVNTVKGGAAFRNCSGSHPRLSMPTGLWLSLCLIHPCTGPSAAIRPDSILLGQERWRLLTDAGQQTWKACWVPTSTY